MRSDWTVNNGGFNIISSDFHSPSNCMELLAGQVTDIDMYTNPLENVRFTFWGRSTGTWNSLRFATQLRYLDSDNYYDIEWYRDQAQIKRHLGGSVTNMTWLFYPDFSFNDGSWHGVGVDIWNDLDYVVIKVIGWVGSEWIEGSGPNLTRHYDPNASALFGSGTVKITTKIPILQNKKIDDIKFESIVLTGP